MSPEIHFRPDDLGVGGAPERGEGARGVPAEEIISNLRSYKEEIKRTHKDISSDRLRELNNWIKHGQNLLGEYLESAPGFEGFAQKIVDKTDVFDRGGKSDWGEYFEGISSTAQEFEDALTKEDKKKYKGIFEAAAQNLVNKLDMKRKRASSAFGLKVKADASDRLEDSNFVPTSWFEERYNINSLTGDMPAEPVRSPSLEQLRRRGEELRQRGGVLERIAGAVEQQRDVAFLEHQRLAGIPERQRLNFLDWEENPPTDKLIPIPELRDEMWLGLTDKEKELWQARLKLVNGRILKLHDLEAYIKDKSFVSKINDRELQELTDWEGQYVSQALCLLVVSVVENLKFDELKPDGSRANLKPLGIYNVDSPDKFAAFRDRVRKYMVHRFDLINEQARGGLAYEEAYGAAYAKAKLAEQIAMNIIINSHLIEHMFIGRNYNSEIFLYDGMFSSSLWELMHPRQKALYEASLGRTWPDNELGRWIREHFAPYKNRSTFSKIVPLKVGENIELFSIKAPIKPPQLLSKFLRHFPIVGTPGESDIPLPETMIDSFFCDTKIFIPKRRRSALVDSLLAHGQNIVNPRVPLREIRGVKINWRSEAQDVDNILDSDMKGGPFAFYNAYRLRSAQTLFKAFTAKADPNQSMDLPQDVTWNDIGKAGKNIGYDKDGRLRKAIVYLLRNVKGGDPRLYSKDSDEKESARFRRNWVKPGRRFFQPKKQGRMSLFWRRWQSRDRYPGFFDN